MSYIRHQKFVVLVMSDVFMSHFFISICYYSFMSGIIFYLSQNFDEFSTAPPHLFRLILFFIYVWTCSGNSGNSQCCLKTKSKNNKTTYGNSSKKSRWNTTQFQKIENSTGACTYLIHRIFSNKISSTHTN